MTDSIEKAIDEYKEKFSPDFVSYCESMGELDLQVTNVTNYKSGHINSGVLDSDFPVFVIIDTLKNNPVIQIYREEEFFRKLKS